jgi:hypothetical protein
MKYFSQRTKENLGYYVYILIDPRDKKIFYVGKGIDNRVFNHVNSSIESPVETEKLDVIREIKNLGFEVEHYIVRHNLEEKEAFLVESVLIDFLTFKDFNDVAKIANIVSGHHSFLQGIKTVQECEILYNCQELKKSDIQHKIIVININNSFDTKRRKKTKIPLYDRENIYEATRGWWVLDPKRAKAVDFVLAEYKGIIRAIFKPHYWTQDLENKGPRRWGFIGEEITSKELTELYLHKSVPKAIGMANPVRYFDKMYVQSRSKN